MLTKDFIISNILGLHIRASDKLVDCANSYISEIFMIHDKKKIDTKRIMQVLSSGAKKGDKIKIEIIGEDAENAMQAITKLIESGFGEN